MPRIRRVDSVREKEKMTDDFVTKGYTIKQQSRFSSKVKEKDWGSVEVHGFVFLFTLIASTILFSAANISSFGAIWVIAIIASIIYATYSWNTSEEVLIKVDEDERE